MKNLLILTLFIMGCKASQPIIIDNHSSDTLLIRETLRDTVVEVAPDSATLRALVECDSTGNAHLKRIIELENGTRIPAPSVTIKENILTSTAKVDSLSIYMTLKDRYTSATRATIQTKTIEVNRLTWWQKTQIKAFWILLSLSIITLTLKRLFNF